MTQATNAPSGFSADTEILTRRGWLTFDLLADDDEVATRSPDGLFEWQRPSRIRTGHFQGRLIQFHSRTLDLLITPCHPVLVSYSPRGVIAVHHGAERLVSAEALFERGNGHQAIPLTALNARLDLQVFKVPRSKTAYNEYVTFDAATIRVARKRAGLRLIDMAALVKCSYPIAQKLDTGGTIRLPLAERVQNLLGVPFTEHSTKFAFTEMSGDDFAAFMGMWLSEGCVSWTGTPVKRPVIYVTQFPASRGYEPYRRLLGRIMGREPSHDGRSFWFRHSGFVEYLEQFGHARVKFMPPEILDLSARLAGICWQYYWLGDGDAGRNRITTASPQMADDLQVLALRMGKWATIQTVIPKGDVQLPGGKIQREADRNIMYKIASHDYGTAIWQAREVPYTGNVYRVSVPNGTLYVRRGGKPAWCCAGTPTNA